MKTKILLVTLLLLAYAAGQGSSEKLWVSQAKADHNGMDAYRADFYFLEDRETHTRCYAVVGYSGTSIKCVAAAK